MSHFFSIPSEVNTTEHETKYIFENPLASMLIAWLRLRCPVDREYESGMISSIYYDTRDWDFLHEKRNSDYRKMKVRLRWYADVDGKNPGKESFLEIKEKIGSFRKKRRIKMDISGACLLETDLRHPALFYSIRKLHDLGISLPSSVFPVFQVNYKRYRYTDPLGGYRVCVDHDIQVMRTNRGVLPILCPASLSYGVFEFKGPSLQLPPVFQQLAAFGCRKESFSKYYYCYMKLTKSLF